MSLLKSVLQVNYGKLSLCLGWKSGCPIVIFIDLIPNIGALIIEINCFVSANVLSVLKQLRNCILRKSNNIPIGTNTSDQAYYAIMSETTFQMYHSYLFEILKYLKLRSIIQTGA